MAQDKSLLYLESFSDEAASLFEDALLLNQAKRLLDQATYVDRHRRSKIWSMLNEIEQEIRGRLRREFIEPSPAEVSKALKERIYQQARKDLEEEIRKQIKEDSL